MLYCCWQVINILQRHNRKSPHMYEGETFLKGRVGPVDPSRGRKVKRCCRCDNLDVTCFDIQLPLLWLLRAAEIPRICLRLCTGLVS